MDNNNNNPVIPAPVVSATQPVVEEQPSIVVPAPPDPVVPEPVVPAPVVSVDKEDKILEEITKVEEKLDAVATKVGA